MAGLPIDNKPSTNGPNKRLILVSNRLPMTIKKGSNGEWTFSKSSGGLVTAISGLKGEFLWVGWVGMEVAPEDRDELSDKLLRDHSCLPVFLSDELVDDYYNGFANGTLWPLFHYVEFVYDSKLYKAYEHANQKFAEVLCKLWQPGDMIWVHDYHLMRFPLLLRELIPSAHIGFFLHIPFPSSEIYKVLPVRTELLEGILASDLIGFHTWDYARHFKKACTRILGAETTPTSVMHGEREVPISAFPVGIPASKFEEGVRSTEVQQRLVQLRDSPSFRDKRILIGVDRLDYIKGIPHKLRGLELFFTKYPQWRGQVVLIQIAVPSRTEVEEYRNQKKEVDELVGRINSTYGSLGYQPINYMYKSVNFSELCALYTLADAALITSLRDGMNLVAHEYVTCQNVNSVPGVLILSEFAGAAQCLGGAIRINPHNVRGVADAIHDALSMSENARQHRHTSSYSFINQHTAEIWGASFVDEMRRTACLAEAGRELSASRTVKASILRRYKGTKGKRLILIDYDGVLVPFQALPSLARPTKEVIDKLMELGSDSQNKVIVISGRKKKDHGKMVQVTL